MNACLIKCPHLPPSLPSLSTPSLSIPFCPHPSTLPPLSPSVHRGLSTLRRRQKAVRIPVSAAAPRRRGGRDHLVGPSAERIFSLHALGAETICFFPPLSLTFPPASLISSPQVRDLCSSFRPFLAGGLPAPPISSPLLLQPLFVNGLARRIMDYRIIFMCD